MVPLVLPPSRRLVALRNSRKKWTSTSHGFSSTASCHPIVQYAFSVLQKLIRQSHDRRRDDGTLDNGNPRHHHRPQTSWERIRNFPEGVKALLRDCVRYKVIHDTSLHQWTVEYPNYGSHIATTSNVTTTTATTTIQWNRIPRRQYEQQRQLRHDMRIMLPLVLVWIPPIIGFLPPLLAIVAPRQFMSRHFHNPYELELFAHTEYQQRLGVYSALADMLWSSFERSNQQVRQAMVRSVSGEEEVAGRDDDEVGPLLDAVTLYKTVFFHQESPVVPRGMYLSIKDLPRQYLVSKVFVSPSINLLSPGNNGLKHWVLMLIIISCSGMMLA
jgi:LETM1-like protein